MATLAPSRGAGTQKLWAGSYDFQLMIAFHTGMMVLMLYGFGLSLWPELLVALTLALVLGSLSMRQRRRMNWRWGGMQEGDSVAVFRTVGIAVLYHLLFEHFFSLTNPVIFPWYVLGFGWVIFELLRVLRIVEPSAPNQPEPFNLDSFAVFSINDSRKKVLRDLFWGALGLLCFGAVFFFCYYSFLAGTGSSVPTSTYPVALHDGRRVVFISYSQKLFYDVLADTALASVAFGYAAGLFLYFWLGVQLVIPIRKTART